MVALLVADIVDTFIADRYGLSLSDQQRGILLGLFSIVLFFLSFGIGFREKSRLITSLLMSGGTILAGSKLVELNMDLIYTWL